MENVCQVAFESHVYQKHMQCVQHEAGLQVYGLFVKPRADLPPQKCLLSSAIRFYCVQHNDLSCHLLMHRLGVC